MAKGCREVDESVDSRRGRRRGGVEEAEGLYKDAVRVTFAGINEDASDHALAY